MLQRSTSITDPMSREDEIELQGQAVEPAYSRLQHVDDLELEEFENLAVPPKTCATRLWWWLKAFLWAVLGLGAVAVVVLWIFLVVFPKVFIPLLEWAELTFDRPVLALVLIGSLVLLPIFLIPSAASIWIAGIIFGYRLGFLIIMAGMLLAVSLQFFIARWLFPARFQRWILKWTKHAALFRIVDQGGWFHQFRDLLILRLSLIPYFIFNYAIATTNVRYGPYICSSCAVLIPESLLNIYSARLSKSIADVLNSKRHLTTFERVYYVVSICVAVGATIAVAIHGKRASRELEMKEQIMKNVVSEEMHGFPASPTASSNIGGQRVVVDLPDQATGFNNADIR